MIKSKFFNVFTILVILLQALMPIPALAMAGSDLADYLPGSVVTISGDNTMGAGYLPLETVHVDVSGPNDTLLSCDATADESGAWSCQVTLPSDDSAAGYYEFTAAGQTSGVSESGAFTVTAPPPPAVDPTPEPTQEPTAEPTQEPTAEPPAEPTAEPTIAPTDEVPPAAPPFIYSDEDDYAPEELVTLTSGNWLPGEKVHLFVNDNIGSTWNFNTDVVADDNGGFTYRFYLPSWFVATYSVVATGEFSGIATTSFTDAVGFQSITVGAQNPNPVAPGNSVAYTLTLNFNGGGTTGCTASLSVISGLPAGTSASFSANPVTSNGTNQTTTLTITTTAGTTPTGSYTFTVQGIAPTVSGGQGCNGATRTQTGTLVLTKSVGTVTVGTQSGSLTYGTGGNATYLVTVNRNAGASGSFSAALSLTSALPVGATASFSPSTLNFTAAENSETSTLTITSTAVTPAGTTALTVQASNSAVPGDTSTGNGSLLIGKATPTITWANPADITYGTALSGTQLNATASVPGTFSYTPASGAILNAGNGQTLYVDFTPTDTANYNTASKDVTINVLQRPVTVTADAKSKTYGVPDPALTYQVTSGSLVGSDAFSGALARAAGENVGTYAINQGTLALSANYNLSFTGANLTIDPRDVEVTADDKSKTYGDADPALTYVISDGSLAFSDSFSGALAREAGENVGVYDINQGTLALNGNYNLTFVPGTFTIGTRAVTVTADAKSKIYGDSDPALTYAITDGLLASGDTFSGALTRDLGENVGSYAITQGTLALNSNYALTYEGADLTITPRPITVTADPQTKVYGEVDPALTYQITDGSLVGGDTFSDALIRDAGENVGTYSIEQGTLTAGANYDLTFVGADLEITKRPITVTADPQTKVYGQSDPTLTYQITSGSLAFSDTFSGSLSRAAGENVGSYAIGQGSLLLSGNYDLTFVGANLTITKAMLTVDADDKSKTYGQADPAFTFQATGFEFDDNLGDIDSAPVCSVTGAHEDAGTYTIDCSGGLDNNYDFDYEEGTLTVGQALLTVTADDQTITYGDEDPPFTFQYSGFQFSDNAGDVDTAPSCNVAGAHVNAGTYTIECAGGSAANYSFAYDDGILTVDPASLTIKAEDKSKTYGSANPALTASYIGFVNDDDESDLDTPVSLSTSADETSAVGGYVITASGAVDANYTITHLNGTLTVNAKALTITADNQSKTYGDEFTFDGSEFSAVGLVNLDTVDSVTLTSAGAPAASGVGSYAIVASNALGSGLTNYEITYEDGSLTVGTRPITVTADPQTKVYGDADPALTYQVTSGDLVNGDAFSGALARAAGEDIGTYAISQGSLALSDNYALAIVGANLTITKRPVTVTADLQTKVYGDADPALTYQITSGSLAFSDAFTGALDRAAGQDVGSYAISQGTLALSDNYDLAFVGANLTITKRLVTVAAYAQTKVYGESDPALTYQITDGSLAFSDAFTGALERDASEDVGTYDIQQGTLALNDNYDLTYVGADFEITVRPVTVTAHAKNKIFGNADPALTYEIMFGSLAFSDTFTGALTRVSGEDVGMYAIQQGSLALNSNYNLSYVGADLNITARPITVTADDKTKTYGDADPALTYQITSGSLAFSDTFTGALIRDPGETVGDYAITKGTLALSTNYNLTFEEGTLTIDPKAASVTPNATSKVYGDADPVFTGVLIGFLSADGVTAEYSRDIGENVGNYTISASLSPADVLSNYDITYNTANFEITVRPITVTADPQTKVYGEDDPALTYKITSGSLAFSDAFSGSLSRVAGEDVGSYAINQGSLTAGDNYDLTFVGATLTITERPITVSADAKTKVYGDNDPALTYQITSGSLVFSDAFTGALTRVAGESVGSYAIQLGSLALNSNYNLTYVGADLTITARPVTITADAKSKTYGGADPALTYQITNGSLAFSDAFTGTLTRAAGENAGVYAILQGTLTLSSNYDLTYVGANLTINKATLTVTADNKSKYFAGPDPAFTFQYSGFVNGETASVIDTPPTCTVAVPHAATGTYPIVCSGGLDNNYNFTYVSGTLTVAAWTLRGFYSPVDMSGSLIVYNAVRGGSTVPLKFEIFSGTTELTGVADVKSLTYAQTSCDSSAITDDIETVATGGTALRYDATSGQFIYNWKTPSGNVGKCFRVTMTAQDNSTLVAYFKMK